MMSLKSLSQECFLLRLAAVIAGVLSSVVVLGENLSWKQKRASTVDERSRLGHTRLVLVCFDAVLLLRLLSFETFESMLTGLECSHDHLVAIDDDDDAGC